MRVTGHMIRHRILRNMQSALERLQLSQSQLATGKRTLRPSHDPMSVSKAIRVRALMGDKEQFQKNIEDALGWLDNSEPYVDGMLEVVVELKEIALRGASDTMTDYERGALGEQVEHLIQQMLTFANSKYGQRYLFAGTHTLTEPYSSRQSVSDESANLPDLEWASLANVRITQGTAAVTGPMGGPYVEGVDYEIDYDQGRMRRIATGSINPGDTLTVAYQTETICSVVLNVPDTGGTVNREVAQGVYRGLNTGGQEILASRVDVFTLMIQVKTNLFRDDGIAINQALDDIETGIEQINSALGDIGARYNAFELAMAKLDSEIVNLRSIISGLEDADLAEVTVKLQVEQMAYESALAAASQIMNTSLLNFMS